MTKKLKLVGLLLILCMVFTPSVSANTTYEIDKTIEEAVDGTVDAGIVFGKGLGYIFIPPNNSAGHDIGGGVVEETGYYPVARKIFVGDDDDDTPYVDHENEFPVEFQGEWISQKADQVIDWIADHTPSERNSLTPCEARYLLAHEDDLIPSS